jgi:MYXO-CTERM domain-containing protein
MRYVNFRRCSCFMMAISLLGSAVSAARADALTPSYTVTDLGSQGGGLSTDANGNTIVINASGQTVSPFPQTFASTWVSLPALATLPLLDPVPTGSSNSQGYSRVFSAVLYPNGSAIVTDIVGAINWQRYDLYYVPRNPDGSWGQPVGLLESTTNMGPPIGTLSNVSATLSKSGDILETTLDLPVTSVGNIVGVYNINKQTYTDLSTLPALVNNGYSNLMGAQIDDDGRILVWADHQSGSQYTEDLLLLTPIGISSVPEPGSWAVMALAMAAFAAHRVRERRRRS